MKVQANAFYGMEVEIKARGLNNLNRYNQKDAQAVLNKISLFASDASKYYEAEGSSALAEEAKELATMLYDLLSDAGYYKE